MLAVTASLNNCVALNMRLSGFLWSVAEDDLHHVEATSGAIM